MSDLTLASWRLACWRLTLVRDPLQCPTKYPDLIEMQSLRAQGWRAPFVGSPKAPLEEVGVSLGPADENGELQGEEVPGGSGREFRFPGRALELEKWVFCGYDVPSGYARVMYQIPVDGQRCENRLKRSRGRLIAASVRCE